MMQRIYKIIGAASGWGAPTHTCEDGPIFLKEKAGLKENWEILYPLHRFREKEIPFSDALELIIDFDKRLCACVKDSLKQGYFPVIVGGDHSNAVGTWNGVGSHFGEEDSFGLIWIDAHMDAHTPETTPSGAWHGMPLAHLLGYGSKALSELTRKKPILKPHQLCLIGIRSFEEGEAALLEKLQVKIYDMDMVKQRGLQEILKEAIAYVTKETDKYAVSLDLDALDPRDAPGTGCFVPDGIRKEELLASLPLIAQDKRLCAFELVEFDPHRDCDHKTLNLSCDILTILQAAHLRKLIFNF